MWHQDMKLPYIWKTHPYMKAWSFKTGGDAAIPPIRDHRPDHMTWVEAVISGLCVAFCREKHTHRPQMGRALSTTNKDDPCLLPIYTHFLFFCFYRVLLFFARSESESHSCLLYVLTQTEKTAMPQQHVMCKLWLKPIKTDRKKTTKKQEYPVYMISADCQRTMGPYNNTEENSAFKSVHHCWC